MKWHSPVQKRKVKRQVMREDIEAPISAPTPRGGNLERVMVIFSHTVQHENIISITEHRRSSVMGNESHEKASKIAVEISKDVMHLDNAFVEKMRCMGDVFKLVFRTLQQHFHML